MQPGLQSQPAAGPAARSPIRRLQQPYGRGTGSTRRRFQDRPRHPRHPPLPVEPGITYKTGTGNQNREIGHLPELRPLPARRRVRARPECPGCRPVRRLPASNCRLSDILIAGSGSVPGSHLVSIISNLSGHASRSLGAGNADLVLDVDSGIALNDGSGYCKVRYDYGTCGPSSPMGPAPPTSPMVPGKPGCPSRPGIAAWPRAPRIPRGPGLPRNCTLRA